eukprot:CAMPEP_0198133904 /NCGR_PEP_ID=MMETSP1442-20131203/59806_1 /TAXON_ID= /ORGANISM="Craspedostauros australis, Strain CCMP3328" /LENGTH=322 /DNA_ID=CAMNT_0043795039 /DNA_START=1080 /DNA_END=2048 /DNA_ORIENTATION=-
MAPGDVPEHKFTPPPSSSMKTKNIALVHSASMFDVVLQQEMMIGVRARCSIIAGELPVHFEDWALPLSDAARCRRFSIPHPHPPILLIAAVAVAALAELLAEIGEDYHEIPGARRDLHATVNEISLFQPWRWKGRQGGCSSMEVVAINVRSSSKRLMQAKTLLAEIGEDYHEIPGARRDLHATVNEISRMQQKFTMLDAQHFADLGNVGSASSVRRFSGQHQICRNVATIVMQLDSRMTRRHGILEYVRLVAIHVDFLCFVQDGDSMQDVGEDWLHQPTHARNVHQSQILLRQRVQLSLPTTFQHARVRLGVRDDAIEQVRV